MAAIHLFVPYHPFLRGIRMLILSLLDLLRVFPMVNANLILIPGVLIILPRSKVLSL